MVPSDAADQQESVEEAAQIAAQGFDGRVGAVGLKERLERAQFVTILAMQTRMTSDRNSRSIYAFISPA